MTPTNRCLDAETLAAWIDGGLSRNDAALAEAHVSSCPRCQEIAGLVVKTTPVTIVDAPWWRRRAAWLVPATVGVAAVGLLMIAPTNPAPSPVPPQTTAALESSRTAAEPAAPPVAPPADAKPAETKRERQRDERAKTAGGAPGAAGVAGAPAAAPPAATAPPTAVMGGVAAEQGARESFAAAAAKQAVSPDGARHWRITDRGALERSTDGGTTWQSVNVGVTATFTTVQAPEPRTALVTTTDGRVFRTVDGGTTWRLQEL